ncbi:MAG: integrase family protein [Alphaproteobacteria bacterium]|nr:integrase family protein [Alphaproteobacteria bacterium]
MLVLHNPATQGAEMARQNRLSQRGTSWVFRARVPDRLRPIIRKNEIHKSFRQVSHADAKRLATLESLKTDALFAQAERQLPSGTANPEPINDENLQALARAYFYQLEVNAPPTPFSDAERAERQEYNEEAATCRRLRSPLLAMATSSLPSAGVFWLPSRA